MFKFRLSVVTMIQTSFVAIALICIALLLFEPPHASSAKAADKKTESIAYFHKLATPTTVTTTTSVAPPTTIQPVATTTTRPYVITDPSFVEQTIIAFFPENPQLWIAIAKCESGLNPNAYNVEGASGLFQVMMPLHKDMVAPGENIFDPVINTRIARSLSRNGTSTVAWNASKGCWS